VAPRKDAQVWWDMREIEQVAELRAAIQEARRRGQTVGFVPTMGYLHEGHLALVDAARGEDDIVVMSIFVNPTQFGPKEDFERYPRDLERDRRVAGKRGVDLLFLPDAETMYPAGPGGQVIWIDPGPLGRYMEGASRPGHFRGVATVVTKLFNLVQPDRAYFGQKDGQQALLVSRMVQDLAFPIEVKIVPTAREPDGLALSSRNVYLSGEARAQAGVLYHALQLAQAAILAGERDVWRLEETMRAFITGTAPAARIDYVAIANLHTGRPIDGKLDADALIALAVSFGATRLIDNLVLRFANGAPTFPSAAC